MLCTNRTHPSNGDVAVVKMRTGEVHVKPYERRGRTVRLWAEKPGNELEIAAWKVFFPPFNGPRVSWVSFIGLV